MKVIKISGIIAKFEYDEESNVTPTSLNKSLQEAGGEDVLITINSPGGSVFHGLEMFSMIKNYPGKTETRIVSLAASMGSILALAGDKKSVENTAMYFIHNAQGFAMGDYRDALKASKWLEDVSVLLAELYEKNTTLSLKEAREFMDADSQFFGSDLQELGFELVETGEAVNQSVARVNAVTRLSECEAKISKNDFMKDLEKVAASIVGTKSENIKPVSITGKQKEEEKNGVKNLEELKAQHPDLYAEAVEAGVNKEKDRVNAHITLGEGAGAIDLAIQNIKDGKNFDQTVSAEYMAEGLKKNDIKNRLEDEPKGDIDSDGDGSGSNDEEETEAYQTKLEKKFGSRK